MAAKAFGHFPRGLGKRALILSNSGGPGVLCADRAQLEGLELGALPKAMAEVLRQQLPAEASVANPIDLLADAREDRFGLAFESAMTHAARHYDQVLMIHVVPFMVDAAPVIARLAQLARDAGLPVNAQHDGNASGQSRVVCHYGVRWRTDVQRRGGDGRGRRPAGALSHVARRGPQ